jgi:hypothetical protein
LQFGLKHGLVWLQKAALTLSEFLTPAASAISARCPWWVRKGFWVLQFAFIVGPFLSVRPTSAQSLPDKLSAQTAVQVTTIAHPASASGATLTFRVYNYARVDPVSLARSEEVTTALFERLGIEITWVDCLVSKAQSRTYPACQTEMGSTDLVLRILPRRMAEKLAFPNEPLGSAQTCSVGEPACELNVFYHRVDALAVNGYRADRILGYVIAHEVAHVLLGPRHSEEGIMRGEWTPSDLQHISWGLHLDFTSEQSRQLRYAVLRRMMPPVRESLTQADLGPR